MKRLTVVATVTAKADTVEEVKAELNKLIEPTRKEEGCINYDLHQSKEDTTVFIFHENWDSEAHLDAHLETPHIKACQAALESIIESAVVHKLYQIV